GGKLYKPGVDAPQGAAIVQGHDTDQVALEPIDRPTRRQPVDLRRIDPRVDRTRHQRHAAWLRKIGIFGHNCASREYRDAGLANRYDMRPRTQHLEKGDDVFDKVIEVEPAVPQTDVASVVPI